MGGKDGEEEDIAVTRFREYLRVNTEQPTPDYYGCRDFLLSYAKELGFKGTSTEPVKGKPAVVWTLEGQEPNLPSLVLYSHTDVVPTYKDKWSHDPYAAVKDARGRIYGRGAQDMKCVGIQYAEAIRRLRADKKTPFLRTVHLIWGPDEEIGGGDGMAAFVQTPEWKALNAGFVLDEGIASETGVYKVFYGERAPWWVKVIAHGNNGHGSKFIENTAAEKIQSVINSALAFRTAQKAKLAADPKLTIGDVTSLNLTKLEGGVQINVVPDELSISFDIRVTPADEYADIEKMLEGWAKAAGPDVSIVYLEKTLNKSLTSTNRADNPWFGIIEDVFQANGIQFTKEVFTGATDSRYFRESGIPSIGFSPMVNTPSLLHDHDEYLTEDEFLRGLAIYAKLLPALANFRL